MTTSDRKITRTYHQEDIQQILQIAIARQAYEGEFSREQLLEIAAELEISPACLQVAEQEWLVQQSEYQKRQEFHLYRRRRIKNRLVKYGMVNATFILLNIVSGGGFSWLLYISIFWGLFLALDLWNTYQSQGEEYERSFQIWRRNHQVKKSIGKFLDRLLKP